MTSSARELIIKTGLTQAQVAKKLGVSERTVQNYARADQTYPVPKIVIDALLSELPIRQ